MVRGGRTWENEWRNIVELSDYRIPPTSRCFFFVFVFVFFCNCAWLELCITPSHDLGPLLDSASNRNGYHLVRLDLNWIEYTRAYVRCRVWRNRNSFHKLFSLKVEKELSEKKRDGRGKVSLTNKFLSRLRLRLRLFSKKGKERKGRADTKRLSVTTLHFSLSVSMGNKLTSKP